MEFFTSFNLGFWGITAETLGTVLIAFTVLNVHSHVVKEKHIDMDVIKAMRKERRFAISGLVLIIVGYILVVIDGGYLF